MLTRLSRNLPNLLTLLRLVLVPFIASAIWNEEFPRALLLLFIAGITDALDGRLARRFNWTSRVGAYLDPVSDKLLLVTLYVVLGLQGTIARWLMWLVLGRDVLILTMVSIALVFTPVRDFAPSIWGKLSTVVQVVTALAIIAAHALFPSWFGLCRTVLVPLTAATTTWSGVHYAWLAWIRWNSLPARTTGD